MIRHSSSARSNVVPLSVDKPVARATANIEWSVYAVCPEGFAAVRGWLCISGTIVPVAPQIHITRVVVSQCPFVRPLSPSPSLCLSSSLSLSFSLYIYTYIRLCECASIRLCIECIETTREPGRCALYANHRVMSPSTP